VIALLKNAVDAWRGSGSYSVTVPPMDGALRPNQAIEEAPAILASDAPDNLASDGVRLLFSTEGSLCTLQAVGEAWAASPLAVFDRPVTALAAYANGSIAVGLDDGRIVLRGGGRDGKTLNKVGDRRIVCPTALSFIDADTLLVALGSQQNAPTRWKHDLMQKNASGSVWRVDLSNGAATCLGDRLAYPYGMLYTPDGAVVVSESWRNQLVRLAPGAKPAVQMTDITGYPARLAPVANGTGAWLAVFAPRSQLIEFVLREKDYRTQMMIDIPDDYWIAPSIAAARSFLEPLQGGALKQLGILKPWAPTRSYGLVVQLDETFEPRDSFHSRADGQRHGITSCIEHEGRLLATSKGGDAIVSIPLSAAKGD
jgi:hypothetical protein